MPVVIVAISNQTWWLAGWALVGLGILLTVVLIGVSTRRQRRRRQGRR